jgi:hypothetical protein
MYAPPISDNTGARLAPATRTRLRQGRLLSVNKVEICDCTLYDLENGGVGIVIPDADADLPAMLYVADPRLATVNLAKVRWRAGHNLCITYLEEPVRISSLRQLKSRT